MKTIIKCFLKIELWYLISFFVLVFTISYIVYSTSESVTSSIVTAIAMLAVAVLGAFTQLNVTKLQLEAGFRKFHAEHRYQDTYSLIKRTYGLLGEFNRTIEKLLHFYESDNEKDKNGRVRAVKTAWKEFIAVHRPNRILFPDDIDKLVYDFQKSRQQIFEQFHDWLKESRDENQLHDLILALQKKYDTDPFEPVAKKLKKCIHDEHYLTKSMNIADQD